MFIKSITIEGFKSYSQSTIFSEFSPRFNTILGRNGSGKSNFFFAIQFILSKELDHINDEMRSIILSEDSKSHQATVHITFDNSDRQFQGMATDEVIISRIIGLKKDQYFVNNKNVFRNELYNLLELSGISPCNPYYIIKQGKVSQLAMLSERDRLDIFLDVAGIKVYQERKNQIESNLSMTCVNIGTIKKDLIKLNELIEAATEDSKLYEEYTKMSIKKSELEAIISKIELQELLSQIDPIEKEIHKMTEKNTIDKEYECVSNELKCLKSTYSELKANMIVCENEKAVLQERIHSFFLELNELKSKLQIIETEKKTRNFSTEKNKGSMLEIEEKIKNLKQNIEMNQSNLNAMLIEDLKTENELCNVSNELKIVEEKIELFEMHKSENERMSWLNSRIENLRQAEHILNSQLETENKNIYHIDKEIDISIKKAKCSTEIAEKEQSDVDIAKKELADLRKEKISVAEDKLALLNQNFELKEEVAALNSKIQEKSRHLSGLIGRSTFLGISNIEKIMASLQNKGFDMSSSYRGIVLDNISFKKNLNVAVEISAKKYLFYHIVDSDQSALRILNELKELNLSGEMNFIALNRVPPKTYQYENNDEYAPLVKYIDFDSMNHLAINFIFGDKILCKNLDNININKKFNWVTLEGDQYNKDGSVSGGYIDIFKSRIETFLNYKKLALSLNDKKEAIIRNKKLIETAEKSLNSIATLMMKKEQQIQCMIESINNYLKDARQFEVQCSNLQNEKSNIKKTLEKYLNQQSILRTDIEQIMKLREVSLKENLSDLKHKHAELTKKTLELKKIVKQKQIKRSPLEQKIVEDMAWLNNYLIKKKDSIQENIDSLRINDAFMTEQSEFDLLPDQISKLDSDIKKIENEIKILTKKINQFNDKLIDCNQKIKDKTHLLEIYESQRSDQVVNYEKSFTSYVQLKKKIDELTKRLDQSSLPPWFDVLSEKENTEKYFDELAKINKKIQENEYIKHNITEQPSHYVQKKAKIEEDLMNLEKEKDSIDKLRNTVEQEKANSIYITFKKISYYFSEIFSKLVPEGKGTIVIKRAEINTSESQSNVASQTQQQSQGFDSSNDLPPIDMIRGIGIKVSFDKNKEIQNIDQLSGGQKSIVALALIFSIQKCDPAPIYLFDEIDAALDEQYRESVAKVIDDLSKKSQFICVSFMPELLNHSDRVFEVFLKGKSSKCKQISKQEGLKIISE